MSKPSLYLGENPESKDGVPGTESKKGLLSLPYTLVALEGAESKKGPLLPYVLVALGGTESKKAPFSLPYALDALGDPDPVLIGFRPKVSEPKKKS